MKSICDLHHLIPIFRERNGKVGLVIASWESFEITNLVACLGTEDVYFINILV